MAATLRQTDFLPNRFDGSKLDSDLCTAHYLSFEDYLQAHDLQTPADDAALLNVVNIFKRTLQGSARLWIEDKTFVDLEDLKSKFIYRFSPSHSQFANVKQFESMSYNPGDTAEQHYLKVKQAAQRAKYGKDHAINSYLPCRQSVNRRSSCRHPKMQTLPI